MEACPQAAGIAAEAGAPTLHVAIGDLGTAVAIDTCMSEALCEIDVGALHIRAPEQLLARARGRYGFPVDVWALGCDYVSLAQGTPAFVGSAPQETISIILQTLGPIPDAVVARCGWAARVFPKVPGRAAESLEHAPLAHWVLAYCPQERPDARQVEARFAEHLAKGLGMCFPVAAQLREM